MAHCTEFLGNKWDVRCPRWKSQKRNRSEKAIEFNTVYEDLSLENSYGGLTEYMITYVKSREKMV